MVAARSLVAVGATGAHDMQERFVQLEQQLTSVV